MPILTYSQARELYDKFGVRQDSQGFYEEPAQRELIRNGEFGEALQVFEFGCGTGLFAEQILRDHLQDRCSYRAVDLSTTMVEISRQRMAKWSGRARIDLHPGPPVLSISNESCDRFVSSYVLDLLSGEDIRRILGEAHRVLSSTGLLCLVGLTYGSDPSSTLVSTLWRGIHSIRPRLLGGCRPLEMLPYLDHKKWRLEHRKVLQSFGISSEVIVAAALKP